MLHLFYAFSNITARMIPIIVRDQNLSEESVVVLLDRSQPSESIRMNVKIVALSFKPIRTAWRHLLETHSNIRSNASQIEKITGGAIYEAYLPSDSSFNCQQILHHPNCNRYYLFEEGLASYSPPGEIPIIENPPSIYCRLRTRIKTRIFGRGRFYHPETIHMLWKHKYSGAYSSNKNAFPGFPRPIVNLDRIPFDAKSTGVTKIFVLDDMTAFTQVLQEVYLNRMEDLIRSVTKRGDHWAYKLHPVCEDWDWLKNRVARIFDSVNDVEFTTNKLGRTDCIEDVGISGNVITYGYMSSCLIYVNFGGGRAVCIKRFLENHEPAFKKVWDTYISPSLCRVFDTIPGM